MRPCRSFVPAVYTSKSSFLSSSTNGRGGAGEGAVDLHGVVGDDPEVSSASKTLLPPNTEVASFSVSPKPTQISKRDVEAS